jgi:peptide deformylase
MSDIILLGDKNDMLRDRMPEFDFNNPIIDPVELSHRLINAMKDGHGIGLAANQIGVPTRCFAMYSEPPMVCFNPVITYSGDELVALEEGCLSYPNVFIKVKRPKFIRVRFRDPYGNPVVKKFDGMAARVFQHELDHLDGVEYFKRAHPVHRERFQRKWKKVSRLIKNAANKKVQAAK